MVVKVFETLNTGNPKVLSKFDEKKGPGHSKQDLTYVV